MSQRSMKATLGDDVIALDTAEQVGKVKHFVVSTDARRIDRLHIDGRGKKSLLVAWNDLESFGTDRVVVKRADAPDSPRDDRDLDGAKGNVDLLGARLLDTAGFEHGTVADVTFDADTGDIVSIASTDGSIIGADRVRSLGTYAAVVDAAAV